MTAFNGGGLLGEERTLLGDLRGGYTVKLHEFTSLPIVRSLGLDVHRRWRSDGVDVAELKPVVPFWMDVNVLYQQGINLAWRTRDSVWKDGTGAQIRTVPAGDELEAVLAERRGKRLRLGRELVALLDPLEPRLGR